ncbi:MAG: hypothetical protein AAGM38_00705 [Pseudomonadota bacterium]
MGLFDRFWNKQDAAEEPRAMDFRRSERNRVATAWPPVEARIGKANAQVLDISENGFCVAMEDKNAPEQTIVEINQGDALIRKTYALRVWRTKTRVGYSFADGVTIDPVHATRVAKAEERRKMVEENDKPAGERPSIRERLKL